MTTKYGQSNPNSKSNRAKRASMAANKFLDFAAKQAESEIEYGHYDAGNRLVTFISEHFVDDPECEGVCDYLVNLMTAHQEHDLAQSQAPAVRLHQAREQLAALSESRMPLAPHFGTLERGEYDNERRIRSERGNPQITKAHLEHTLRNEIQSIRQEMTT